MFSIPIFYDKDCKIYYEVCDILMEIGYLIYNKKWHETRDFLESLSSEADIFYNLRVNYASYFLTNCHLIDRGDAPLELYEKVTAILTATKVFFNDHFSGMGCSTGRVYKTNIFFRNAADILGIPRFRPPFVNGLEPVPDHRNLSLRYE